MAAVLLIRNTTVTESSAFNVWFLTGAHLRWKPVHDSPVYHELTEEVTWRLATGRIKADKYEDILVRTRTTLAPGETAPSRAHVVGWVQWKYQVVKHESSTAPEELSQGVHQEGPRGISLGGHGHYHITVPPGCQITTNAQRVHTRGRSAASPGEEVVSGGGTAGVGRVVQPR